MKKKYSCVSYTYDSKEAPCLGFNIPKRYRDWHLYCVAVKLRETITTLYFRKEIV